MGFEPYRNPVEVDAIQDCIVKALQIQQEHRPSSGVSEPLQPRIWIVTPTLSSPKLVMFGAVADQATWGKGIYLLAPGLQTGIIVIHQLPVTPETLLFRLMGRDRVQQTAMEEIAALPMEDPYRKSILDLLVSYRMELAAKQAVEPETDEQELIMQLSPLYLEQLESARQEGEQRGEQRRQDLVIRQLNRQVGVIGVAIEEQVRSISTTQLESLGEALLDFKQMSDLLTWLQSNGS